MAAGTRPGMTYSVPGEITVGKEMQRGFINDNILHSPEHGDIHYSSYIPEAYDGTKPYALFVTLPGWEGLYFQGVGANMVKVYLHGYSGGGETGSLVMAKRPELYTAFLCCATKWDGDMDALVKARTPVYLVTGESIMGWLFRAY